MTTDVTLYLLAGAAAILSLAVWLAWIVVPAYRSYDRWWERGVAVLLAVYVLSAAVLAGASLGVGLLFYSDRL